MYTYLGTHSGSQTGPGGNSTVEARKPTAVLLFIVMCSLQSNKDSNSNSNSRKK